MGRIETLLGGGRLGADFGDGIEGLGAGTLVDGRDSDGEDAPGGGMGMRDTEPGGAGGGADTPGGGMGMRDTEPGGAGGGAVGIGRVEAGGGGGGAAEAPAAGIGIRCVGTKISSTACLSKIAVFSSSSSQSMSTLAGCEAGGLFVDIAVPAAPKGILDGETPGKVPVSGGTGGALRTGGGAAKGLDPAADRDKGGGTVSVGGRDGADELPGLGGAVIGAALGSGGGGATAALGNGGGAAKLGLAGGGGAPILLNGSGGGGAPMLLDGGGGGAPMLVDGGGGGGAPMLPEGGLNDEAEPGGGGAPILDGGGGGTGAPLG